MKYLLIIIFACCIHVFAKAQDGPVLVKTGTNAQFNQLRKPVNNIQATFIEQDDSRGIVVPRRPGRPSTGKKPVNPLVFEADIKVPGPVSTLKKTASASPQVFTTGGGAIDPMIAVGLKYLITCTGGTYTFYDKAGNVLPDKPGGIASTWSATSFFQPIMNIANNNSFSVLTTAPDNTPATCGGKSGDCKILCEAYDSRVIYEPENKRFIIATAIRNRVWRTAGNPICNVYATRIFAYAISNTEDPRDGFKMWYWTKNNYRDWPRISADKDVLIEAHNGAGDDGTPTIYVISMQDMMNGVSSPRWFTYRNGVDDTPDAVVPVAKFKSNTYLDNYELFLKGDGDNAVLYYFKKSANMWTQKPELKNTDIDLDNDVNTVWEDRPVCRNGSIYFSTYTTLASAMPNISPVIHGFELYRLPIKKDGEDLEFDDGSSKLLEYPVYPKSPDLTNYTSYDMPAVSVNESGVICTAYGRWSVNNKDTLYPEARFFLFYPGEAHHRQSQLLKKGESMPMFKYPGSVTAIPDGYYNDNKDAHIDYATTTPDPADKSVFWIAHMYGKDGGYKMIFCKIIVP